MLSARVPPRRAAEVSDGAVLDVRGSWFGLCSAGFGGAVYAARSGAFTASFSLFGASCADSVACGARRKGRAGGGGARQSEACALGVASFKRPPHAAGSDWDVTPGALATALNKRRPAPPPLPRPPLSRPEHNHALASGGAVAVISNATFECSSCELRGNTAGGSGASVVAGAPCLRSAYAPSALVQQLLRRNGRRQGARSRRSPVPTWRWPSREHAVCSGNIYVPCFG